MAVVVSSHVSPLNNEAASQPEKAAKIRSGANHFEVICYSEFRSIDVGFCQSLATNPVQWQIFSCIAEEMFGVQTILAHSIAEPVALLAYTSCGCLAVDGPSRLWLAKV